MPEPQLDPGLVGMFEAERAHRELFKKAAERALETQRELSKAVERAWETQREIQRNFERFLEWKRAYDERRRPAVDRTKWQEQYWSFVGHRRPGGRIRGRGRGRRRDGNQFIIRCLIKMRAEPTTRRNPWRSVTSAGPVSHTYELAEMLYESVRVVEKAWSSRPATSETPDSLRNASVLRRIAAHGSRFTRKRVKG